MKRKLIVASMCLAMVLALGGCTNKNTGSGTTSPSVTPSASPSTGVTETPSTSTKPTDPIDQDTASGAADSTDNANSKSRTTTRGTDANGDGILHDVGDAAKDMANGTERAVKDIL